MKQSFFADNNPGTLVSNHLAGKLFNRQLTGKVIKLHSRGYELDFYLNCNCCLVCAQTGEQFICDSMAVKLIDQVYDLMGNSFQYIHTVETVCGGKGLLIIAGIYGLKAQLSAVLSQMQIH